MADTDRQPSCTADYPVEPVGPAKHNPVKQIAKGGLANESFGCDSRDGFCDDLFLASIKF
jgi:hypothetical protein